MDMYVSNSETGITESKFEMGIYVWNASTI
jgi:hypothetical protein